MSSIRDVAKYAGVSIATVSRVLNNDSTYKMTEETRNKVWKAVGDLNYRPRNTRSFISRSETSPNSQIGCVMHLMEQKYRDPYFMSILAGIESRLRERGQNLSFLYTYDGADFGRDLLRNMDRNTSGLILMDNLPPDLYKNVHTIVPHIVGIDTRHSGIDNVGYDHYRVMAQSVEYLVSKGHRQIGFIGGSPEKGHLLSSSRRYLGFFGAMHAAGLSVEPKWVWNCHWEQNECFQIIRSALKSGDLPSAIVCGSDLMAIAVLSALNEAHIDVPGKIAVIGLSDIELSRYSAPPLTTLEVPTAEIGILAVDLLFERINGYQGLPRAVTLPTNLVPRLSA